METSEDLHDILHREVKAVRDVLDAKVDGIHTVLGQMGRAIERLTDTVERQSEHQTQLALLTQTVSHFQANFIDHRRNTDDRLDDLEAGVRGLEEKINLRNWKLNAMKAGIGAVAAGGIGFVTANFATILKLAGLG